MTYGTSYTVTSENATCTTVSSSSFSIDEMLPTPATPTITEVAATCLADGTATVSNYDGSLTYTFAPAGPTVGAGGVISNMTYGTSYTVTSENATCTTVSSSSFSIDEMLPTPATPTITEIAATCLADGTATVSNYDGSLTYTFTPAGPTVGAGGVISNMTYGTSYTVTSENATCTTVSSSSFSIDEMLPTPATPTITEVAATCLADGTATVSNYDGSLTYTFAPAGPTVGAGGVISNMTYGTSYTVTSENATCTTVSSSSFSIDEMLPTPATPTITEVAATCLADGTATVSNYDGSLTYTFAPAGPTVGAGGVISNMTYGTSYTVTSENATCTTVSSSSFSIDEMLPTPATPAISEVAATCLADGTATVSNYDGSLTYTFTPAGPTVGAGGVISNMTYGTSYTVTSENATCTTVSSSSFSIDEMLPTPATPAISEVAATCLADGTATVSNYDGSLTYTFTPAGPTVGAGGVISNMTYGTSYTVTSENATCTTVSSSSFSIDEMLPTPATPAISEVAATCLADGTATVSNYDGSLTYTFAPAGPTVGAGGVISNMTYGTSYTVTSENATCTTVSSSSFSIDEMLPTPATPAISEVAATCLADGTATVSNYDGTLTYTFTPAGPTVGAGGVISNMTYGTSYTVTSENATCTTVSSSSFSIDEMLPTPATPAISEVAATCLADGTATVSNYDGSLTYTFTPAGPTVGAGGVISNMTYGTSYTVTSENATCTTVCFLKL